MKHKRTLATDIPPKIKQIVWERDNHRCIFCKRLVPVECANAHYIKRSQGGLGITPENIFTACPFCHDKEDFGHDALKYREFVKKYLSSKHEGWSEDKLYYRKGVEYEQF